MGVVGILIFLALLIWGSMEIIGWVWEEPVPEWTIWAAIVVPVLVVIALTAWISGTPLW